MDSMADVKRTVYLPGDSVHLSEKDLRRNLRVVAGPGLRLVGENTDENRRVIATQCGLLRRKKDDKTKEVAYWLDTHSKKYIPVQNDRVIGYVSQRLTEGWKVDIGSAETAQLNALAFENVTKKTRPQFREGTLVYARLETAIPDMEPELVCYEPDMKARGLGELPTGGLIFQVPLNLCRRLISKDFPLLDLLGKVVRFETTVGTNGRVWLKCASMKTTVELASAIQAAVYLRKDELTEYCQGFNDRIAGLRDG